MSDYQQESRVKADTPPLTSTHPRKSSDVIRGLVAPNLTPFNDDLSIAEDLYVAHAGHLLANGCDGLAPFGTTGEATSVGLDERKRMLEKLVDSGIDPDRLLPGTGVANAPDTISLTRHALSLGCVKAMILPPFYFKGVTDQGIFDYYDYLIRTIADDRLRIYLYHIPQLSQVGFSLEVIGRLRAAHPEVIAGIKDSSGDWSNTKAILETFPGFNVYPGNELPLLEGLQLGSAGCITATANINSRAISEVIGKSGTAEAQRLQDGINGLRKLVQSYAPIPAMKGLFALASGDRRWNNVRPPLVNKSEAETAALAAKLDSEIGFRLA